MVENYISFDWNNNNLVEVKFVRQISYPVANVGSLGIYLWAEKSNSA